MGEFIYSFIQIIFIAVELSYMYNVLLVDTCLIYFIMRSLFG